MRRPEGSTVRFVRALVRSGEANNGESGRYVVGDPGGASLDAQRRCKPMQGDIAKALRLDQVTEVAGVLAADEGDHGPLFSQSAGQGEAAHDVAGADGGRGVGAEDNLRNHNYSLASVQPFKSGMADRSF